MKRALAAAFGLYLLFVGLMVFTPASAAPGGVVEVVRDWLAALGFEVSVGPVDFVLNIVLFLPFGLLGRFLFERPRVLFWLVAGALASAAIETIQLAIPGRMSTLLDVLANGSGAALGAAFPLLFAAWGKPGR